MPRKTCTPASSLTRAPGCFEEDADHPQPAPPLWLAGALGGFEEDGEPVQVVLAEVLEARHRRAWIDAARALEVVYLELDALVLGALRGQVRRAQVGGAGALV